MSIRPTFSVTALAASLATLALGAAGSAQALTITLSQTNCASYTSTADPTTGNVTIACGSTTPLPPALVAPSGCTLSAPSVAAVGDTISVSARCTAGAPVDFTLNWSGPSTGSAAPRQTTSASVTTLVGPVALGTYDFTATASNLMGTAGVTGARIVVSAATPPPPPPPGTISCASQGFAATRVINLKWGALLSGNVLATTASAGGWGPNQALVVSFTTPSKVADGKRGIISIYEFAGAQAYKTATLSTQPCDFGKGLAQNEGTTVPLYYSVGTNTYGDPQLQPNTTYYFNVVNRQNGVESCYGDCNAQVQLKKPSGL